MNRRTLVLPVLAGLLATTLAACGSDSGSDPEAITVGTTDQFTVSEQSPAPFDPAAVYDVGKWNMLRSTFQTLLRPPRTGTEPTLEAAKTCVFTDEQSERYRCTLRSGLTFSNGNELTAHDVEFSIKRVLRIDFQNGPASLLSNIDKVQATSDTEIVFHLKKPDATFPYKLATPAAAIVDAETYPRDSFLKGYKVVGSGPYTLESYDPEKGRGVLVRNPNYKGTLEVHNERIVMRSFDSSQKMMEALKADEIDVMTRGILPQQVQKLRKANDDGINLIETPGMEIRYLVFDTNAPTAGKKAVRQAMAQIIDRKALVRQVYRSTAEPLYSLVPSGIPSHTNSFFNKYGEPDVDAARRTLREAGIEGPVELTLHYTTDHYGKVTRKEFETLRKQLNSSGLFDVTIKGAPWAKFQPAAADGKYEVYGFGWYPDFADPDNFIAPFFTKDNFLKTPYVNEKIRNELIPRTRRETNRSATTEDFGRIQDIVAEEVPVLPLWQGKQYIAAQDDITGVEWALNSASVLQLWELGRGV